MAPLQKVILVLGLITACSAENKAKVNKDIDKLCAIRKLEIGAAGDGDQ